MRLTEFTVPAPKYSLFERSAFQSQIGKTTKVVMPEGERQAIIRGATVSEDGRYVTLVIEYVEEKEDATDAGSDHPST